MKNIFLKFIVIGATFIFLLAGCATAAQRQAQQMKETNTAAGLELKSCSEATWNSPEFAPARARIPLDLKDATLDQMMDSSKPTPEEIAAIKAVHPQIVACRNAFLDKVNTTAPTIAAIFVENWDTRDSLLIQLLQHKITWGKYITDGKALATEEHKKILAEAQRIDGNLQRSHDAEMAQRQAASNAFMQYYQNQEVINAMNRPQVNTTTCTGMGNTVNCMGVSR